MPLHLIILIRYEAIDLHAEVSGKLSEVLLGNYHFGILLQYLGCVLGQRIEVCEVSQRYLLATLVHLLHGRIEVSVRSAETDNQQVGIVGTAFYLHIGHRDALNLLGTEAAHQVVVVGSCRDGARLAVLLQSTEDVGVALLSGDSPVAYTCLGIALVGSIVVLHLGSDVRRIDGGIAGQVGQLPGTRTVGYERIGEQHHRSHVLKGNLTSIVSSIEALGG